MSESPAVAINETFSIKKDLIDPRTISKNNDQQGRDKLAADIHESRVLRNEVKITETKLGERQNETLVKLKSKLHIADKQTIELQTQLLEQKTAQDQLPDRKKMVEAYYEKAAETPLTNQEKKDLLKPEVLSQLSSDEYIALWKRLNPHFLANVTRQGLRDHTGNDPMLNHSSGQDTFLNSFTDIMKNEKRMYPTLSRIGLKERDETNVKIFLSKHELKAETQEKALDEFDNLLHGERASAPSYPDMTATHFAAQMVSNIYYGAETGNEVFFVYPSDVLASQYPFAFNGFQKDFTRAQSEDKWNDVFIWTDPNKSGVPIDSGFVFLPKDTKVDPNTGSKYASEIIKGENGQDLRIPVEDDLLIKKFENWVNELNSESPVIKAIEDANERRNSSDFNFTLKEEMLKIGVPEDSIQSLLLMSGLSQNIFIFKESETSKVNYIESFKRSNAKYKRAEVTIPANEYWEKYFVEHPDERPKHVIYYNGDPTSAIYRFQQENGIGSADTSKTDGQLLGFDDNHVTDMANDPRSNQGHDELVALGNKIITEHYATR